MRTKNRIRGIGIPVLLPVMFMFLLIVSNAAAQRRVVDTRDSEKIKLDSDKRAEIIDSVGAAVNRIYVFPEVAEKMTEFIRKQNKDHAYDTLVSPIDFGIQLTRDMRSISHDRHLGVRYFSSEDIAAMTDEDTARALERQEASARYRNYGFQKVERLDGNVGYLDFTGFSGLPGAGRTAIAAMNFLAYTDALIIDMRQNGGGSPSMIQLISSYLFDEPVHLNSFYIRQQDSIKQFWTQTFVDGPRMTDIPVYVLTSDYTFSAAEEFTYNLKNLKRATIVGEITGGGAHPVQDVFFPDLNIGVRVPYGRAINPISGTNWEGTGVEPDIKVPADSAFDVAYLEALKKINETTEDELRKYRLNWTITGMEAARNPITLAPEKLAKYAGQFGPRKIWLEDGQLFYRRENGPIYHMYAMGDNLFGMKELDTFRIEFVPDKNGDFNEIIGLYDIGQRDGNKRTE